MACWHSNTIPSGAAINLHNTEQYDRHMNNTSILPRKDSVCMYVGGWVCVRAILLSSRFGVGHSLLSQARTTVHIVRQTAGVLSRPMSTMHPCNVAKTTSKTAHTHTLYMLKTDGTFGGCTSCTHVMDTGGNRFSRTLLLRW